MRWLLLLFIFSTFFYCKAKSQIKNDTAKSAQLWKDAFPFYKAFLGLDYLNNKDSGKIVNDILIYKYKKIYELNPKDSGVGNYLIGCYIYDKEYEKAIYWIRHQLLLWPSGKRMYFENLSYSFICLGNLDSSKFYLNKAFKIFSTFDNPYDHFDLIANLWIFADSLYLQPEAEDLIILKKTKKQACKYSVEILKLIMPFLKESKIFLSMPFDEKTIQKRQKNCW